MCRRDQLLGVGLMAFGLGLLAAGWIESGLLRWVLGIGVLIGGFWSLRKQ